MQLTIVCIRRSFKTDRIVVAGLHFFMKWMRAAFSAVAAHSRLLVLFTEICIWRLADTRSLTASQNLYAPKFEQGMAWRFDSSHKANLSTVQITAEQVMPVATGVLAQYSAAQPLMALCRAAHLALTMLSRSCCCPLSKTAVAGENEGGLQIFWTYLSMSHSRRLTSNFPWAC